MKRKMNEANWVALGLIILIFLFLLVSGISLHGDAVPAPHPQTGEEGYWISEEDLQASIVAAATVDVLEKERKELIADNEKRRKREGFLIGTTTGTVIGVAVFILLSLFGGGGS